MSEKELSMIDPMYLFNERSTNCYMYTYVMEGVLYDNVLKYVVSKVFWFMWNLYYFYGKNIGWVKSVLTNSLYGEYAEITEMLSPMYCSYLCIWWGDAKCALVNLYCVCRDVYCDSKDVLIWQCRQAHNVEISLNQHVFNVMTLNQSCFKNVSILCA